MPSRPRSSLPFGAVMATGAASELAETAGVGWLRVPLLLLAVAIAATVIGSVVRVPRRPVLEPAARIGDFTIPLGLAVIGNGVAGLGGYSPALGTAAIVAAAWIYTGWLVVAVIFPLVSAMPGLATVDGTWFLAPAALLADGIGATAVAARFPGHLALFGWIALAAVSVGVIGYLLVAALAAARLASRGIAGTPLAAWWIAAGCGGLAAAALGRTGSVFHAGPEPGLEHSFGIAALLLWALGSAALVPVLSGSIRFVAGLRRLAGRPPWPPTFSTGVYALGAAQVGRLLGAPFIAAAGNVAAVATIVLWALTVVAKLPSMPGLVGRFQGQFDEQPP